MSAEALRQVRVAGKQSWVQLAVIQEEIQELALRLPQGQNRRKALAAVSNQAVHP